ncbi:MAG: EAL domain-containing protein [Acetobacteraceae bacterium]
MTPSEPGSDRAFSRIATILAAAIALVATLAVPAAYFLASTAARYAEVAAEANLAAATMSQLASRNPELWVFENARIRGLLGMLRTSQEPERIIVTALNGDSVAEQGDMLPPPVMASTSPIYDAGRIVGHVQAARSQQRVLLITGLVALLACSLGAFTFVILRALPMRLLRRALRRSTHLATHDTLTGLPNRALFQDRLEQSLAWSRRESACLAVLYLDLDRFKDVNDTLGHAAGDRLLAEVATRLRACVRETDTLGRLGGDEFAVVQVGVHQFGDTELLARRMIDAFDPPFDLDGALVSAGVSIGIAMRGATAPGLPEIDAGLLLQEADVALYRAKEEGRGTYRFFAADMNQRLLERRALEADMLTALATEQFVLHYQPQFELIGRRVVGAEALLRWRHPQRGEVPPEAFVPLAEETGVIVQIGEWALYEACRQAAAWPTLRSIAVNVSPVQFRRPGFFEQVQRALRRSGLNPSRLEIEITEGILLQDTDETLAMLRRLRGLGIAIAMDDFGTGYSSLGYLQRFRFDKIKIDRSFIRGLASDPHAAEIVRAVLRMSHAMGIRVNAEGVEHEQQAALLRDEGCEEAQGFLFAQALSADEFADLLARNLRRTPLREAATA